MNLTHHCPHNLSFVFCVSDLKPEMCDARFGSGSARMHTGKLVFAQLLIICSGGRLVASRNHPVTAFPITLFQLSFDDLSGGRLR